MFSLMCVLGFFLCIYIRPHACAQTHTHKHTHTHHVRGLEGEKEEKLSGKPKRTHGRERARNKEGHGYMERRGYAWRTLNSVIMISAISLYCDCFLQSSYLIELVFTDTFISAIQVCLK